MRLTIVAALILVGLGLWLLTAPQTLTEQDLPEYLGDAAAGERVFWAGGCASCHATPVKGKRAKGADKLLLGGGMQLESPYGIFEVPNISPHADGIGGWSLLEFVNAMQRGVSPDGRHYYPSFPYTSYARAPIEDIVDLKAYLDTLPEVAGASDDHSLGFPWSVRRGIGAWKRLYLDPAPVLNADNPDPFVDRGRALVEGLGHCGECHTPRNALGGLQMDRWLAGAPDLEGKGSVPNITPAGENIASWSAKNIAYYLESGFTPEFDTVGGTMVAVQENMARLTPEDRQAIAAYLKSVPAVDISSD
jgi:mono/diheme cytochrome c family protein